MPITCLYKYGRLNEHSEVLFTTPTVWFSPPAGLNDPFECRPWLTFEGTESEIVASLTRTLKRRHPEFTDADTQTQALAMFHGLSDTPDWEKTRRGMIAKFSESIGLYCLSRANDSILMWSHYAQDHRGYCLQFEATDFTPVFGRAQEVRYVGDLPVVNVFDPPRDQVDQIFLTKFAGWSYEEEWRLIDHGRGPGLCEYPPELLKSVIFGLRMPSADRAKIGTWLKQRPTPVKMFETIQHERQFAIEVRAVDA
jgi:hypothetical protein